ncbi:hypothetical protein [Rhizobium sp. BK376]|uniref:hypothetical protein n=1 Tax=Rhizobium sp. BK376 TaxID=2512149 RepID=UPI0010DC51AC|nr:hypothetical protein [Rhizobium sp. BK376]TCR65952.1 hypothetical protein EV561_1552 [Rhizobium sp. BK376]
MCVPNDPVAPPLSPPYDPDRIPGGEPPPDSELDEGAARRMRASTRWPTRRLLCRSVLLSSEEWQ